jgi:hypothetical protein
VIYLLTTPSHVYTHDCLLQREDVKVEIRDYESLHGERMFPRGTYIFTDMDRLGGRALAGTAELHRRLRFGGARVLNDPARVLGRYGLLRKLHAEGINDFTAYRADSCETPVRWPVFLRSDGGHDRPLSGLIHGPARLAEAIEARVAEGAPITTLLIVEYAAQEAAPGLFRKLSVFRLGDAMIGHTCVHDRKWIVKYGKGGIATPELYEDEYRIVAENPYGETLRRVFDLAGIEYGRADFGLIDGRPQIYEINTNPHVVLEPKSNGIARRDDTNAVFRSKYLAALKALDAPAAMAKSMPAVSQSESSRAR